jgi:hypothetical protein
MLKTYLLIHDFGAIIPYKFSTEMDDGIPEGEFRKEHIDDNIQWILDELGIIMMAKTEKIIIKRDDNFISKYIKKNN